MKSFLPLSMGLVFLASVSTGSSAQITTEQFNAGAGGWQGSSSFGGTWTFTGGAARVTFPDTGFIAIPDVGTLSNLPSASGGSFTGNFEAAGIELIGFRFFSATETPSSVRLVLGGPTSVYQTVFYPTVTGVWQTLAASLQSVQMGGWTNLNGPETDFEQVRQNVKYVAIRVDRAGATARMHGVDEIFLDRLPVAGSLTPSTGTIFALQGEYLRTNETYRIEAATNLAGSWSPVASMVATSRLQLFSIPVDGSASQTFFRFRGP